MTTTDAWWLETDEQPKATETAEAREARQRDASDALDHAIHQIAQGMADLNTHLANATELLTDTLAYPELAATIGWLQERKRELGEAEAYLARELGRLEGCPDAIHLGDGRVAEVMKGRERKEWRHADWQHDVREKVAAELGDNVVMDPASGETWPAAAVLAELIAKAQAVHGSSAPKAGAAPKGGKPGRDGLKALGLDPDDYSTSYPGPYSVRISAPETTTQEG